ncbi:hypothetical protein KGP36_01605 [Patescibacteria group bacterium]|nr:hypothetical protein [Patescibacteria group bacterium]
MTLAMVSGQPLPDGGNGTWVVTELGKIPGTIPKKWTFATKAQGDLLLYAATNDGNGNPIYVTDPNTGDHQITRMDINADYWLSDNDPVKSVPSSVYAMLVEPEWVYPSGDATLAADDSDRRVNTGTGATSGEANQTNPLLGSANHSKSRAWGYVFVPVYTVTDSRGNKIQRYGKPSQDLWIEDRIYKPATLGAEDGNGHVQFPGLIYGTDFSGYGIKNKVGGHGNSWRDQNGGIGYHFFDVDNNDGHEQGSNAYGFWANYPFDQKDHYTYGWPTNPDYFNLRNKFRGYATDVTTDPYYFAATWLGWWTATGANLGGAPPYKVACPASELWNAPQTVFNFDDFDLTAFPAGSVTEIRIYRTGHFGKDDKANSNVDSLSEPHIYGYAGSVKPGSPFTDNVADNALDTGDNPFDYDGFEVGQYSGQVARDFMTKLWLGNIRTTYWIDTPGPEVSANYCAGQYNGVIDEGGLALNKMNPASAPDRLNLLAFHFAYVDQLGNNSDLRDVVLNYDQNWGDAASGIFIVPPRGADPFITGIHIWASYSNTGTRTYYDLGTIPVTQPMFSIDAQDIYTNIIGGTNKYAHQTTRPSKDVKQSYEPTQGIYSVGDQPYNFPAQQVEDYGPYGAVVGAETVYGDLLVFMTSGSTWTTLNGGTVRIEENTRQVGCVSRFGICKWNKGVFFLSPDGVYIAEGDGISPAAGQIATAIRKYLDEQIPGQPRLANAMRASMGALAHRYEIWIHFPSSLDLWTAAGHPENALPQATFIYKFTTGEIRRQYLTGALLGLENYQFDLTPDFALVGVYGESAPGVISVARVAYEAYRSERVLLYSHGDGTLWAAFHSLKSTDQGKLSLVNCDYSYVDWQGTTCAEKPFSLGMTSSPKQLRQIYLKMKISADIKLVHGAAKPDFSYDPQWGHINTRCRVWPVTNGFPDRPVVLASRGTNVAIESKAVAPIVRVLTQPDTNGDHHGEFQSLNFDVALKHHHPR